MKLSKDHLNQRILLRTASHMVSDRVVEISPSGNFYNLQRTGWLDDGQCDVLEVLPDVTYGPMGAIASNSESAARVSAYLVAWSKTKRDVTGRSRRISSRLEPRSTARKGGATGPRLLMLLSNLAAPPISLAFIPLTSSHTKIIGRGKEVRGMGKTPDATRADRHFS